MPRVVVRGAIGPSNTLRLINADADRSINWYVRTTRPGSSAKVEAYDAPTPGMTPFAILTDTPVTCLFYQDGRAFAVAGSTFYEVFAGGTYTAYGAVATAAGIAPTICSNGTAGGQLFITAGLNGYIFDLNTNVLTLIADADFPQGTALMGEFMDGYFLVLVYNSRRFQISALEDGTTWDALDVFERSEGSDNVQAMVRVHREIWFPGSLTGEVWYDSGDALTPFQPMQGVFIEQGCANGFTAIRLANTLYWVGQNAEGFGAVYRADGYTPERISTDAVEEAIQQSGYSNARAWGYQQDGSSFYVLMLPDLDTSWVYEVATGLWHERATWDSTDCVWLPYRGQCHMFAFNKHLIGDRSTAAIYEMSDDLFTEELVAA